MQYAVEYALTDFEFARHICVLFYIFMATTFSFSF